MMGFFGLTHHSTGPARKAAQAGEFRRWALGDHAYEY